MVVTLSVSRPLLCALTIVHCYCCTYSYRTVSHLFYFHIAARSIASRRKSAKAVPAETGTTPSKIPLAAPSSPVESQQSSVSQASQLQSFARKLGLTQSLSVQVFYHDNTSSATFVVTKNLRSLISAVKNKYAGATKGLEQSVLCGYKTKAITLTVPHPQEGGWCVLPEFEPAQIEIKLIREYREGKTPPNIHLRMKWTGKGEPVEEKVKIAVGGTSVDSFLLSCKPVLPPLPRASLLHVPCSQTQHNQHLKKESETSK